MTLDEKIEKEKQYAGIKKRQAEEPNKLFVDDNRERAYREDIAKEAEESRQLTEWLEELKAYRTLDKTRFSDGYNKAIDDFVDKADDLLGASDDDIYCKESIKEIAEQLKAGDVD